MEISPSYCTTGIVDAGLRGVSEQLCKDDSRNLHAARAEVLLQHIERATGKKITREPELVSEDQLLEDLLDHSYA